jgi:hypothetical protein
VTNRFRTVRRFLGPSRFTTDGESGLVGYALDIMKDGFVERVRQGLLARFPQNDATGAATAPPDALVAMGRDRRVARGIFDTDVTYAARLRLWLDDRRTSGNPFTLMRQLAGYTGAGTVSFRTVDNSGNWYARDAAGVETSSLKLANWNWDGSSALWSRGWVIIYPGTLWTAEGTLGDGTLYGDAVGTIGTTATQEQAATLHSLVTDWSPAGTQIEIIVSFDPAAFNPASPEPNGLWRAFYKYVANTAVASRLSTARYFGV